MLKNQRECSFFGVASDRREGITTSERWLLAEKDHSTRKWTFVFALVAVPAQRVSVFAGTASENEHLYSFSEVIVTTDLRSLGHQLVAELNQ